MARAASALPEAYGAAISGAERKLGGVDTLHQRDAADEIYNAWYDVAKLHAQRRLGGGVASMRAVTLDALSRLVRKDTSFLGHSVADDFVVLTMLNHVVKILSLVRTKTKFLAMLAVPSDPALADLAGTLDARRKFADALPAAYIAPVLRVATASNLGTQRRCAALEVVRETAALAGAAASQDPEAAARTALSQAVDADLLATVAASTGSDIILRKASMDALRAAAGGDLATYAPRVAKNLLARASDVTMLVPVWGMGALLNDECVDIVVSRIRREWRSVARRRAEAAGRGTVTDPAMAGVATAGFLGIAGGGPVDASAAEDSVPLPPFAKAALESLFEALLNDRAGAGDGVLAAATPSSGAGSRVISAAAASPAPSKGDGGPDAWTVPGAGTVADASAGNLLRILAACDASTAIAMRAVTVESHGDDGSIISRRSRSGSHGLPGPSTPKPGSVAEEMARVDMDKAPERASAWLDLARVMLELRPADRSLIGMMLLYPTAETLDTLASAAPSFHPDVWTGVLLPWATARLAAMPGAVTGAAHDQCTVDTAREWVRTVFESRSLTSGGPPPPPAMGRAFFRLCVTAISRGYSETERFPEAAARILAAYIGSGHAEAVAWAADALAPGLTRSGPALRASTELITTLLGAADTVKLGDDPAALAGLHSASHRQALLLAVAQGLSPASLALWRSLALTCDRFLLATPEAVEAFASAAHDELDIAIGRMQADPTFASGMLAPADALHASNASSRVPGYTEEAGRWVHAGGAAAGASAGPEALSALRGASAREAVAAATTAAADEVSRLVDEGSVSGDPFAEGIASFRRLSVAHSRRKLLDVVDTARAVAMVAPPSAAPSLLSALLKAVALLPPDLALGHRADAEAASLLQSIAAAHERRASEARAAGRAPPAPLPADVVQEALSTLGPQARSAVAALFPATCLVDADRSVRLVALRGLTEAAATPEGAAALAGRDVVLALLAAVPNDAADADDAVVASMGLEPPVAVRRADGSAMQGRFARFAQGLARPTDDVIRQETTSMTDVQVTGAQALVAAAVTVARVAVGEGRGAAAWTVEQAAAVATSACARLLMAAGDTAASDAETLPDGAVMSALSFLASALPGRVVDAMAASDAGRRRFAQLRRASPAWSAAISGAVERGAVVVARSKLGAAAVAGGAAAGPAAIPGGVPTAGRGPRWVPDWAAPRRGLRGGQAVEERAEETAPLFEFELAETGREGRPAPEYDAVLEQFRRDAAATESDARSLESAATMGARAPPAARPVAPLPSAPPAGPDGVFGDEVDADHLSLLDAAAEPAPPRPSPVVPGSEASLRATGAVASWSALREVRVRAAAAPPAGAALPQAAAAPPPPASGRERTAALASLMQLLPDAPTRAPMPVVPTTKPVAAPARAAPAAAEEHLFSF